jgi:hypothetical protein
MSNMFSITFALCICLKLEVALRSRGLWHEVLGSGAFDG